MEVCNMEVKCPVCGAPLEGEVCTYCGHRLKTSTNNSTVQSQNANNISFVTNVVNNNSQNISNQVINVSKKNKITALILCVLFGLFGVHRFYVGKIGTGLLYLCTGGLFLIGYVVDIILIITGKFKDKFGLELR